MNDYSTLFQNITPISHEIQDKTVFTKATSNSQSEGNNLLRKNWNV